MFLSEGLWVMGLQESMLGMLLEEAMLVMVVHAVAPDLVGA